MNLYSILKHAHSGIRWIVVLLVVLAIIIAISKWMGNKGYGSGDRRIFSLAMVSTHVQLLIGLILYFISPYVQFSADTMKDSQLRFFTMEHTLMMVIGIILITIGFSRHKKKGTDVAKFKTVAIFYLIGFLIILAGIPWPFRGLGAGWF